MKSSLHSWLPIGILAVLAALFVGQALSGGHVLHGPDLDFSFARRWPPCAEALAGGQIPLWTTREFFGFPLLSSPETAFWYPLHGLVISWLTARAAIQALVLIHLFLAACFAYGLGRSLGMERAGGVTAAATFAFGGYAASQASGLGSLAALPWLPGFLWAQQAWLHSRSTTCLLAGSGALAFQALAFPAQTGYTFVAAAIGCVVHVLGSTGRRGLAVGEAFGFLAASLLLSAALFAGQGVPAIELDQEAAPIHSAGAESGPVSRYLSARDWLGLYVPHAARHAPGAEWTPLYLGPFWPMLAILGLMFGYRRSACQAAALAALAILLASAGGLPVARWIEMPLRLPPASDLQPDRAAGLATLGLALLCGLGADTLGEGHAGGVRKARFAFLALTLIGWAVLVPMALRPPQEPSLRTLRILDIAKLGGALAVGSGCILVALRFPGTGRTTHRLLLGLQVFSLFLPNAGVLPRARKTDIQTERDCEEIVAASMASAREGPLFRVADLCTDPRTQTRWSSYRIDSISGFSHRIPIRVKAFTAATSELSDAARPCSYVEFLSFEPFVEASNCRYLVVPESLDLLARLLARQMAERGGGGEALRPIPLPPDSPWRLYEWIGHAPRVRLYSSVRPFLTPEEVLQSLREAGPGDSTLRLLAAETQPELAPGTPRLARQRHAPHQVEIEVRGGPAWVLLSDLHYPGWRAFVDGKAARIYPGQFLFRAVLSGPGDSTVQFVYEPQSFRLGLWLSLLGLGVVAALAIGCRRSETVRTRSALSPQPSTME
ncbi:MAG: hypothetical protein HYU36_21375 [Planctomycetes bacterium]|nr:hypothetical protein [Planctomycetota bacterium]